jgi:hypothetical protein
LSRRCMVMLGSCGRGRLTRRAIVFFGEFPVHLGLPGGLCDVAGRCGQR